MPLSEKDITKLKEVVATKDDLKAFATKEDLKNFATKDDLRNLRLELLEILEEHKLSISSDIADKFDVVLKEIKANREERTLMSYKLIDHEDRITVLEEKFPPVAK